MRKFSLIFLFSALATACTTTNHDMPKSGAMVSDKMATPAMQNSTEKSMHNSNMMDGMEMKKETPAMSDKKM